MRLLLVALLGLVPLTAQEKVDLSIVHQIKTEAFENSKVMDHLSYLTDWYGPRLTGSPEFKEAADWAVKRLKEFGLDNPHLEKWGPFGRSWSLEKYSVEMLEPRYALLAASPLAWSQSTNGPVSGELILAPLTKGAMRFNPRTLAADVDKFKKSYAGKLKSKIVLISEPTQDVVNPEMKPQLTRYTDAQLSEMSIAPTPFAKQKVDLNQLPEDPEELTRMFMSLSESQFMTLFDRYLELFGSLNAFLMQEGVTAVLRNDARAHDALTFSEQAGPYKADAKLAPATFVVTAEHYNRLARLLEKKAPVRVQVNLKAKIVDGPVDAYNIVAEIPGGAKKDEIVMLGAHFDSWHSGTGATDNASGSAVMIEVMRILKALNFKMDRTVRIALWSGEEQGLLGSKAYVTEHFADPKTMQATTAHQNFAGYFNLDNGSGKVRGVYLQGNDAMRPLFEAWLAPFRDQGVSTISIRNTGGTDHLSFDAVGLPGFQFIQDPLDYGTVTHHSNMDVYDHAQAGDLMQASAVIATCVYETATRADKLPRKPLPKPEM
ncbi:MAG: M20/M25/M40 family metallo-hydrolase [Acidobacteriaceae bacterium]|nr:M20/M25/M40 family metallo-hydrolase [Acidobacteriaceae bacterium]